MAISRTDPLPDHWIGVDLNTTGHIAVVAHPTTGKVMKLGKKTPHVHAKYSHLLQRYRTSGKRAKVKKIRNRERSILKDLNHQISKQIVGLARVLDCGIKLERLYSKGQIQKRKQTASYEFSLNNGSFYQLQKMVETKARKAGVSVAYVNPAFTSKNCSRCGMNGIRKRKRFECPHCGHADHADVNAAFNIASVSLGVDRLYADRDACDGSTDTPKKALARTPQHSKPGVYRRPGMSESIHAENIFAILEQLSIAGVG